MGNKGLGLVPIREFQLFQLIFENDKNNKFGKFYWTISRVKSSEEEKLIISPLSMDEDGKVKCSFLKKLSPETFDTFVHQMDLNKGITVYCYF